MSENIVLIQKRICETLSGNLAYAVGRLAFRQGRPMLVEHVGCIYLEHDLQGRVLTEGYSAEYNIVHVWAEESMYSKPSLSSLPSETKEAVYASGIYR